MIWNFLTFWVGRISDSIVIEFINLWTLIARAESSAQGTSQNHHFVDENSKEVSDFLLKFVTRANVDRQFRKVILYCLNVRFLSLFLEHRSIFGTIAFWSTIGNGGDVPGQYHGLFVTLYYNSFIIEKSTFRTSITIIRYAIGW